MELAKVTSKGQITIPLMIRNKLQLKTGDKVFFEESRGKIYITNASQITLANVQAQMKDEAKKAGFVDTNVVISAMLFPNGKVAKVFSHLLEKHTVIISSYTKEECKEVFEKKFPAKIEQLEIFFNGINFEEYTTPNKIDEKKYPKIRDIKDLPVLVSAILSDSDILLTGDKDFEEVKIDKPLIYTPAKYFELIEN